MGRRKTRINDHDIAQARKKIKSTPKRGRWPKYDDIVEIDRKDFEKLVEKKEIRKLHKSGILVFDKEVQDILTGEIREVKNALIRFNCLSYNSGEGSANDSICVGSYGIFAHPKIACSRTSCPYYKKGFITTAVRLNLFEEELTLEKNRISNIRQAKKEEEDGEV